MDIEQRAFEELRLLQDSSLRVWQMYMNWFTWFVGASLLALSWVLTSQKPIENLVVALASLMSFNSVLGIGAVFFMSAYHNEIHRRGEVLAEAIVTQPPDIGAVLGDTIKRYARWATAATLAALLIVWVYVGYHFAVTKYPVISN